ncbi:MAG: response regulator [Methanoregula sp.]|nr:response regulator [Methanoregula sp.]
MPHPQPQISILYVDDEADLLDLTQLSLEKDGEFSVRTALSGAEALRRMKEQSFDAVVSDYQMPGMDGIELLKQIRTSGSSIPFIIFTGHGREEVAIEALNSGADFYLRKGPEPGSQFTHLADKVRDVVFLKQSEIALIESEERYRILTEQAFDGVMIQDFSGTILSANSRMAGMFGYAGTEELIGQNALSHVTAESRTMVMRDMQNVIAGKGGRIQKYRAIRKDRSVIQVESYGTRITYHGKPACIIALRDITERERSDDSIKRANAKMSLLNSVTRHDVNNQVHALLGYVQLARMQNSDPMVADFLNKAEIAGSHISRQLDFTRFYQDLGLKDPKWHNLRRLVDKAAPKTIQFTNDCQNLEIFSDPMLENVFVNLFDNAIRHGVHMTHISVWCMEVKNGIVIVVEDNGEGVPLDLKAKIFDKGFGKHTGFGLFLAREVLGITGISIHETGVHKKGARFEIYVPSESFRIVPDIPVAGNEDGS